MNKEDRREYMRKYFIEHREHLNEVKRKYRAEHPTPPKSRASQKKYYETHKKQIKEYSRQYYLKKTEGRRRHLNDEQLLKIYYDNKDAGWAEMAKIAGIREYAFKIRLGFALMDECRRVEDCALKPLLPEYGGAKK